MEYHLRTPLDKETVKKLRTGDTVYISGKMITLRDEGHMRFIREGADPGIDLNGFVLYHCGPIVEKKIGEKNRAEYDIISAGPTTSMRLEPFEADFIAKSGVSMIVGKGGMGEKTANACREFGCVHGIFPGGCAVLAAERIKKVEGVIWEDLGMPEAMWILDADEFGPVTVNIDTAGGDLMKRD